MGSADRQLGDMSVGSGSSELAPNGFAADVVDERCSGICPASVVGTGQSYPEAARAPGVANLLRHTSGAHAGFVPRADAEALPRDFDPRHRTEVQAALVDFLDVGAILTSERAPEQGTDQQATEQPRACRAAAGRLQLGENRYLDVPQPEGFDRSVRGIAR